MRRFLMALLALGFCCCMSIPELQAKTTKSSKSSKKTKKKKPEAGKVKLPAGWQNNLEKAQAQALKEKKPCFVIFADGRAWDKFQRLVLKSSDFQKLAKSFVPVYVECPKKRNAAVEKLKNQYSVTSNPTAVLLSSDGTELGRVANTEHAEEYCRTLQGLLDEVRNRAAAK